MLNFIEIKKTVEVSSPIASDIKEVIKEAIWFAKEYNCEVKVYINDIDFTVYSDSNVDIVFQSWKFMNGLLN